MWNMHKSGEIVINTGPILALIAGTGSLSILGDVYARVVVPFEVCAEVREGGTGSYGIQEFEQASFLEKMDGRIMIPSYLRNSLDLGESSVIQTALDCTIATVCIDEAVGRRVARLSGLHVTGSLGILLKAKQ